MIKALREGGSLGGSLRASPGASIKHWGRGSNLGSNLRSNLGSNPGSNPASSRCSNGARDGSSDSSPRSPRKRGNALAMVLGLTGLAFGAAIPLTAAAAPAYPTHTVTLIVPIAAGGSDDVIARIVAQRLTEHFGKPFIVDNRPGGGNTLGSGMVARAQPDGYTLLLSDVANTIAESLHKHLSYDNATAFDQVALLARTPYVLVVNPQLGVKDVRELIARAQAKPGTMSYASAGVGTGSHLAGALFAMKANIDVTHVPYKGGTPAMNDLLGSHVDMLFVAAPTALPFVKSGKLQAVMTSDPIGRWPDYPNTPTSKEAGLPDYSVTWWAGLSAPKGTPKAVIDVLNREVNKILRDPEIKQKLAQQGMAAAPMTPQAFDAFYQADVKKWADVISASHVPTD